MFQSCQSVLCGRRLLGGRFRKIDSSGTDQPDGFKDHGPFCCRQIGMFEHDLVKMLKPKIRARICRESAVFDPSLDTIQLLQRSVCGFNC